MLSLFGDVEGNPEILLCCAPIVVLCTLAYVAPSISFMVSFITLFTKDVNSCSVNMILFRFIFFIFFGYRYLSYCKYTTTFSNIQLFIEK